MTLPPTAESRTAIEARVADKQHRWGLKTTSPILATNAAHQPRITLAGIEFPGDRAMRDRRRRRQDARRDMEAGAARRGRRLSRLVSCESRSRCG